MPERSIDLWGAFLRDIKIAHSVFALPFAASALMIGETRFPTPWEIFLLLVCMVSARSFAMGMNRFLDASYDAKNPRTQQREIPRGRITRAQMGIMSLLSAIPCVLAALALNPLAGGLSVPLLLFLATYSILKRHTWLVHWYLGLCLGLAPVAVTVALEAQIPSPVLLLGLAVTFWTAGFDLLYSLQDILFDRDEGLQSFPARFGVRATLTLARVCSLVMLILLATTGILAQATTLYFTGLLAIAAILAWQHWLVRDTDDRGHSPRLNTAFFTSNAWVSVLFFATTLADLLSRRYF
jgi:4-hydroxybenzoate polyprenyltransferase